MWIINSLIAGFALTVISYVGYAAICLVRAWIFNRRGGSNGVRARGTRVGLARPRGRGEPEKRPG